MDHPRKPARAGVGKLSPVDLVTLAVEAAVALGFCIGLHALLG